MDCEVLVLVGIVACGKTHWSNEYQRKNPEKNYYIIGRSLLHNRWKNVAQERRLHLSERKVSVAVMKLISIAQNRPRNYILDQTNCSKSSRKRRLEAFKDFGSKKAVLVLPSLSDLERRLEMYKKSLSDPSSDDRVVCDEDIIELKSNIVLPTKEEGFDEIMYIDCTEDSSNLIHEDYKYDANKQKKLKAEKEPVRSRSPLRNERRFQRPKRHERFKDSASSHRSISNRNSKPMLASAPRRQDNRNSPRGVKRSYDNRFSPQRRRSPPRSTLVPYQDPYSSYEPISRNSASRYRPESDFKYSPNSYRQDSARNTSSNSQGQSGNNLYGISDYSNYTRNVNTSNVSRPSSGRNEPLGSSSAFHQGRTSNHMAPIPYSGYVGNTSSVWPAVSSSTRRSEQPQSRTSYSTSNYPASRAPNYNPNSSGPRGGFGGYSSSSYSQY